MRQKGPGVSLLKEIEASFLTLLQVLLFVAVDEFAVATKQWLTLSPRWVIVVRRGHVCCWDGGGISITVLGSQFWLFACSGTGAVKGICFAILDPAFL